MAHIAQRSTKIWAVKANAEVLYFFLDVFYLNSLSQLITSYHISGLNNSCEGAYSHVLHIISGQICDDTNWLYSSTGL